MCILCVMLGSKLNSVNTFELPDTGSTFTLPRKFVESEDLFSELIDWDCVGYTTKVLHDSMTDTIIPLRTTGDGNCLLHALSRALWGSEVYCDVLRSSMYDELKNNTDWYRKNAPKFEQKEFDEALLYAGVPSAFLGFLHVFALANLLKRPITIYASDQDVSDFGTGEGGVAATLLPTRIPPSEVKGPNIPLAWNSKVKNHYVPVVLIEGKKFDFPVLDVAFKESIPPNLTADDYIVKQGDSRASSAARSEFEQLLDQNQKDILSGSGEIASGSTTREDDIRLFMNAIRQRLEQQRRAEYQRQLLQLQKALGAFGKARDRGSKSRSTFFLDGSQQQSGEEDETDPDADGDGYNDDFAFDDDDFDEDDRALIRKTSDLQRAFAQRELYRRKLQQLREIVQLRKEEATQQQNLLRLQEEAKQARAQAEAQAQSQSEPAASYDMTFSINLKNKLGQGKLVKIHLNYGDDPERVAREMIREEGISEEKYLTKITKFIEAEVKKKMAESSVQSKHFPFKGDLLQYPVSGNTVQLATSKLLSFNLLQPDAAAKLSELSSVLEKVSPSDSDDFVRSDQLDVLYRINMEWPEDKVFPAIDLLRIATLLHSVSSQLAERPEVFTRLCKLAAAPQCARPVRLTTLKLCANALVRPPLATKLLSRNFEQTLLDVISGALQDTGHFKGVLEHLISVSLNLAVVSQYVTSFPMLSKLRLCELSLQLLRHCLEQSPAVPENLRKLIAALGTVLNGQPQLLGQIKSRVVDAMKPCTENQEWPGELREAASDLCNLCK